MQRFDQESWKERLADSLVRLCLAKKPFLQRYWQTHGFPPQVMFNGRDESPFPGNDLFFILEEALNSARYGSAEYYLVLKTALDPVRGVLRDHPTISHALGRQIGIDDIQIGILNSTTLTSLTQLIVGQIAQNREETTEGFLRTASDLNVLLLTPTPEQKHDQTGTVNVGVDMALFHGILINREIDLGEGYALVPLNLLDQYVDREWLREVAPEHVDWRRTEGVFAIIHRFWWRPRIRNKYSVANSELKSPPPLFHRWVEEFANLLAVTLGTRTSWIMTLEGCISRAASDLLGQHHAPNSPRKGRSVSHLFNAFDELKEADFEQIKRARALFLRRRTSEYAELAPLVYRLAEAFSRDGRFAAQDRVLDLAIVFERLFKVENRQISRSLQNAVAELLGRNEEEKAHIMTDVKHLYDVRSAIIHGPSDARKSLLLSELARAWSCGSKIAREAILMKLE